MAERFHCIEKDLVAYRTRSGKVYILEAFCLHMGTHLGIGGTVVGEDIRCPFHLWTFNGEGVGTAVPGLEDPPKAKIESLKCIEQNGWVYVWYDKQDFPSDWLPPKIKDFEKYIFCSEISTQFKGHILDIWGNLCDENHIDKIHSSCGIVSWKNNLSKNRIYDLTRKIFYFDMKFSFEKGPENEFIVNVNANPVVFGWRMTKLDLLSRNVLCPPVGHIYITAPLLGIKILNEVVLIPVTPLKWRVKFIIYYQNLHPLCKLMAKLTSLLVMENIYPENVIWNNKKHLRRPHFTKFDKALIELHRWYKERFCSKQQ